MKRFSDKELEIMNALWKVKRGFLKDIISLLPDPKPAYTTVSTMVNRLIEKEHVGFDQYGRDKEYFPKLKKRTYFSERVQHTISHYFDQSPAQFASFFTQDSNLTLDQLEELKALVNQQIEKKKEDQ